MRRGWEFVIGADVDGWGDGDGKGSGYGNGDGRSNGYDEGDGDGCGQVLPRGDR